VLLIGRTPLGIALTAELLSVAYRLEGTGSVDAAKINEQQVLRWGEYMQAAKAFGHALVNVQCGVVGVLAIVSEVVTESQRKAHEGVAPESGPTDGVSRESG
jgi:hypothetical protein